MARQTFGGDLAAFAATTGTVSAVADVLLLARSATGITAWTALTGGTQVTDLQDLGGGTITTVSSDGNGLFAFKGPDGVYELWLDAGLGARQYVSARLYALVVANDTARQADLANRPVFIVYGTGSVPLRTTYTADTTKMAIWVGTTAPGIATNGAGGLAVDGLDWWWKF